MDEKPCIKLDWKDWVKLALDLLVIILWTVFICVASRQSYMMKQELEQKQEMKQQEQDNGG